MSNKLTEMNRTIRITKRELTEIVEKAVMDSVEMAERNACSSASYIYCKDMRGNLCVLAGKRGATAPSAPNLYNVPVGMRERGESVSECAARECLEETGLSIPLGMFKFAGTEECAGGRYGANFAVRLNGTTTDYAIGSGDGENSRFVWIPLSGLSRVSWAYGMDRNILKFAK